MRKTTAALLAIVMLASFGMPASGKPKPKKPKPYEETGHVLLPNAPLTWYEFGLESCPGMPVTQGVTAYVFKLPTEMYSRSDLVVDVTSTSPTNVGGLGLVFFDIGCASLGTEVPSGPVVVPPGTAFILAGDFFSANYDVTIRVTPYGTSSGG